MDLKKLNPHKFWDSNAKRYDEFLINEGDDHQRNINWPSLKRMLGSIKGKRVLDAGSGNGLYTNILFREGANVSGVDFSNKLVEIARLRYPDISFFEGDLTQSLSFDSESFDIVFCKMVLMDIPVIKKTISEFNRILKPRGECIISILHPFYPLFYVLKNLWGEVNTNRFADVTTYFTEVPTTFNYRARGMNVPVWVRPLNHYLNGFADAGFSLQGIDEPPLTNKFLKVHPEYDTRKGIPMIFNAKFSKRDGV